MMARREVAVSVNDNNGYGKKSDGADQPSSYSGASSSKFRLSFQDVLTEAVGRSRVSSNSGSEKLLKNSDCDSSWRLLVSRTKSRLIDPPEEHQREVSSEGIFGNSDDEEDDIEDNPEEFNRKFSTGTMFQWVSLVLLLAALFCSLSFPAIKKQIIWDLPLWKWEILILALICGRLVSGWVIRIAVILMEHNFLLRRRVLYFVYGLRRAVQTFLWLCLVLLVWHFIFGGKVEDKDTKSSILPYVTKILICLLVGTFIWLLKILVVKVLASSFHVKTFFDRIQHTLFNQYVIETLSVPPIFGKHDTRESEESVSDGGLRESLLPKSRLQKSPTIGKSPRFSKATSKKHDEEIRIDHLHKLSQTNISAWNMRKMVNIIRHGSLSTLDEKILNSDIGDEPLVQIRSECQAKEAAKKIFHNVAKPGSEYINLDDVMRFMSKGEALRTMHHLGASTDHGKISKSALKNWVVSVFKERRALALSLNDTKTAVDELHGMLDILIGIIIIVLSLIILGIPITHFLVFISSQLLLAVFIFGNTCKTVFEAIIFVFVMHPYDVGDRCEIDGEQMVVDEMNILTTVFLRRDYQKIMYPNSVLSTKAIGNYYRSPEMTETIDLSIDMATPAEKIGVMKERVREYVERKQEHWHPGPMVVATGVEDMNMKMSICVMHRMNHQNMGERWSRRSHLVEEIVKVMTELDIKQAFCYPIVRSNSTT